jgi:anti-anti-sigma regulatory factor
MIPYSVMLAGYAVGVVLAVALLGSIVRGFSGTSGFLRILWGFGVAFFAALTIASAVASFSAPWHSAEYYLYRLCFPLCGLAAYVAFRVMKGLGQLNRSLESSVASLDGVPGLRVKKTFVKPTIRFSMTKGAGGQPAQGQPQTGPLNRLVLAPKGTVSAQSVAAWQQVIEKASAGGPRPTVVDLAYVTSLDSAAADAIVQLGRHFGDAQFTIVAPAGSAAEQALKQLDPDVPIAPALRAGDPLENAIERAQSWARTQGSAPPGDPNTWKGF